MVIEAARLAIVNLFAPELRKLFWKTLGITLLLLLGLWLALRSAFIALALPWLQTFLPDLPGWAGWFSFVLVAIAGLGFALVLAALLSPVTAVVAGLFLDDVAEAVERRDYPDDIAGKAMPLVPAVVGSLKFLGIVILGNAIALALLLVPGVNLIAFFVVNGYLLGREFFEFSAMRFRLPPEARLFRARHGLTVFLAGLVIAAFLAIPFINLLTPLFAAAMMTHLNKMLSRGDLLRSNELRR